MKQEVKKINKQYRTTLLVFLLFLVLCMLAALAGGLFLGEQTSYIVYFGVLILIIFFGPVFRARLEEITNVSYIIKIKANESEPIAITHLKNEKDQDQWLLSNEYEYLIHKPTHDIYYKVTKDHVGKIFKKNLIHIVVILDNKTKKYYLDAVDEDINKLFAMLREKKTKMYGLFVTQIKRVKKIDETLKEQLNEIVFVRSRANILSTVNVALFEPSDLAVMLYADEYTPSLYYRFHIDSIKSLL
jgi:hypothetical protein